MSNQSKALANSQFRPLKTSKLNPYVMRPTQYGETRISPRLESLAKQGQLHARDALISAAESKAHYTSGLPGGPKYGRQIEARQAAADMVRRYRKTGQLSAVQRLTELNARMTEFAYGDNIIDRGQALGFSPAQIHTELFRRKAKADVLRAGRYALPAKHFPSTAARNGLVKEIAHGRSGYTGWRPSGTPPNSTLATAVRRIQGMIDER